MSDGGLASSNGPSSKQSKGPAAGPTSVKDAKKELEESNKRKETAFKGSVGYLTGLFGLLL